MICTSVGPREVATGPKSRVFFALCPDATTAARIGAVADSLALGGRRVKHERLHLTLAFLGSVDSATVTELCQSAAAVRSAPFTLQLDQIGYFARPRIVWLGATRVPVALTQLAGHVVTLTTAAGADNPPFRAHVSLARDVGRPQTHVCFAAIPWPVRAFCLLESGRNGTAGEYSCLGRWPLGPESLE